MIAELARQQPPWSVSTPAAVAMIACRLRTAAAPVGRRGGRPRSAERREQLVLGLTELGLPSVPESARPVRAGRHRRLAAPVTQPARVAALRPAGAGFAVRRGETFPGLGPDWIRIAVRDRADRPTR